MDKVKVTDKYLKYRDNVLKYTNIDMNLELENDEQVYIAVFDIPTESGILFGHTKTLALVFGLNTHIYFGNGDVIVGLEKNKYIMKAMQRTIGTAVGNGKAVISAWTASALRGKPVRNPTGYPGQSWRISCLSCFGRNLPPG